MKGRISEIFVSIQGEGLYIGRRQIFVRFYGCNLSCKFCDTWQSIFREYDAEELLAELSRYFNITQSVSFTGGEPLLQLDFLKKIMSLTSNRGFSNYLETNGTLPEALKQVIDLVDIVAMDFKLPSSTGMRSFWDEHRLFLEIASHKEVFIKIVVTESTSEEDIHRAINLIQNTAPSCCVVLQPDSSQIKKDLLSEKIEDFKKIFEKAYIACCVIPQIHKLLGVP
ncbi:MAG: 7-carboxy-7-deazaguanine synthase QueE [Candidatus Omnitrophica bacterium]|nr:7-carboxy-7-deazaguanine synthase QueE [Candidatus Omnitrophota bacterium]